MKSRRLIIFSDTHACRDYVDRDTERVWTANGTKNMALAVKKLQPDYIHHLGDGVDDLPAEYDDFKQQINNLYSIKPDIKFKYTTGNHEMWAQYDYPNPLMLMDPTLQKELNFTLSNSIVTGDTYITLNENVDNVEVGKPIIIIQTPDYDTTNAWFLSNVQSIDSINKRIYLVDALDKSFNSNSTAVRQGLGNERPLNYVRTLIEGTDTPDTKHYYTIGNNVFIFLGLDEHFPVDENNKIVGYSNDDLNWLETVISNFHSTHNVFICTHIIPSNGIELGGINDWGSINPGNGNTLCPFNATVINRLRCLCSNYNINMWMFGHAHTGARDGEISPNDGLTNLAQAPNGWGNTWFFAVPSTTFSGNYEGQIPVLDFYDGMTQLDIKHYSVADGGYFRTQSIPLNYPVNLGLKPVGLQPKENGMLHKYSNGYIKTKSGMKEIENIYLKS